MEKSKHFVPPSKAESKRALGDLKGEKPDTIRALDNIDNFWTQIRKPQRGDWLYPNGHKGQTYDNFKGKAINSIRDVLYLQPIVYRKNSVITPEILDNMRLWLLAFYSPCKVKILPNIYEEVLIEKKVNIQQNCNDKNQYNAIGILNLIIGPIQNSMKDAIGVISFTDVDLFTERLSNYCFGYGIPSLGGVQSIHRFMPDFTDEEYDNEEVFKSKLMLRILKIATHEIGHMFGHMHCIHYNCLMMGTNGLWQTDQNPIYFCPICYRKLYKCLKFNHKDRYEQLTGLCKKFGEAFLEPQPFEPENMSVGDWFKKRYDTLKNPNTVSYKQTNLKNDKSFGGVGRKKGW